MDRFRGCVAEERPNAFEDRVNVLEERLHAQKEKLHVRKDRINALDGGNAGGRNERPSSEAGSTHGRGDLRMGNGMGRTGSTESDDSSAP